MKTDSPTIDLFCRVIDNFGDIGVCWRLARQLVAEHGYSVRLIVDDLHAFRFIAPAIDADAVQTQVLQGVVVVPWRTADALRPSQIVIEAFACDPPAAYVQAMAARKPRPVWLNLEYLSAEHWVDDIHGRPSPHPRLPLTKYFFCPGFTEQSGGLIREQSLGSTHSRRLASPSEPPPPARTALKLFAFTYPQAPVGALVDGFGQAGLSLQVTTAAPLNDRADGWRTAKSVPQQDFDALLADFDWLVVRGEDSFVRAQWAGKPMLWHIYPTDDNAHVAKLDAWLDVYCSGLPTLAAATYRAASHAFVVGEQNAAVYGQLGSLLPVLREHAVTWRNQLLQQTDLASRLVRFIALVKT